MEISGGSLRNEKIRNSQLLLKSTFDDDGSFRFNTYFWQLGIKEYDKQTPIFIRFYERRSSSANGTTCKFQTLIDTPVVVGDVIYDSKSNEYFLCTESFNIDDIHYQGKLTLCNWILKWQNKNGDILEYPCYDFNSTQYNTGEQYNRQFAVGSSQHTVWLPCDENTVILDSPQRFFLDKNTINPTSFVVTQNDTTSLNIGNKGIVKVTLYECERNQKTDRFDLGICDYVDKSQIINNNSNESYIDKSIIYYDTTTIKSGGDSQIFVAKFFDNNGNEINDIVPKWNIVGDFVNLLDVEMDDDYIKIGVDNDNLIDEEFKLILSDIDNNFVSTLILRIDSLL